MVLNIVFILVELSFVVIALTHFYWAWSAKSVSNKVVPHINGQPAFTPSKAITFLVGIIFIGLALFILAMMYHWQAAFFGLVYKIAGSFIMLVFFMRAIGDFNLVGFFKKVRKSEFATYDTRFWSPLCVVLGLFIGYLTWCG